MNLMFSLLVCLKLVICASGMKNCKEIRPRCMEGNEIHTGCLVNRTIDETIYSEISRFQDMKEEVDSLQVCDDGWFPYSEVFCFVEGKDVDDVSHRSHKYLQVVIKAVLVCTRGKFKVQNEHFSEILQTYFSEPESEIFNNSAHQSQETKNWIDEKWLYLSLFISVSVNVALIILLVIFRCPCRRQEDYQPTSSSDLGEHSDQGLDSDK